MSNPNEGEDLLSDEALVRRAQRGDKTAFDDLIRRYEQRVITVAYRWVGQHEDALDLAQETFFRAYRAISGFRAEATFRTWLYQILINLARNRRRWYARHHISRTVSWDQPAGEDPDAPPLGEQVADPAPDPRARAEASGFGERVRWALEKIPPEMKSVVILRDMEERTYEEIARILKQPVGTVKSRLHRGRALLKEALETEK